MKKPNYGRLTAGLIAVWFILALLASALHLFTVQPNRPPIGLGFAALIPVAIFLIWFGASPAFHQFAMSLDVRILTFLQSWRIGGYMFLVLASAGLLPVYFAWPAGWGDFAIGITAPLAALKLSKSSMRGGFIVWQTLGIVDLVLAVSLGANAWLISPHGVSTAMMSVLPMSMVPTFAVPLFIVLHIICIAQAREWAVAAPGTALQATAQ